MLRLNNSKLHFTIVIIITTFFVFKADYALACVGARQMAMGGAFIGVADDISSVYWNPAGISRLDHMSLHITSTVSNRDMYRYDDFLAFVWPVNSNINLGVSFISEHIGTLIGDGQYKAGDWITCSFASGLTEKAFIGTNLRYETHWVRPEGQHKISGFRWGLDVGFLYRMNERLSIGCLVQDIGLSKIRWIHGESLNVNINIRPGIGYKPDPYTLIAMDIYAPSFRIGTERWLTPNFAARFGYYGIEALKGAITWGIGFKIYDYTFDYAYLDIATIPGHAGLGSTHQIGVTVKF